MENQQNLSTSIYTLTNEFVSEQHHQDLDKNEIFFRTETENYEEIVCNFSGVE